MILVLQFRTDQSGSHEVSCIYEAGEVPYNAYSFLNVNSNNILQREITHLADMSSAIILGGMGESGYSTETEDEKEELKRIREKMLPLIREWIEDGENVMGMCFGHQLIGDALGVEVAQPDDEKETGVAEIFLTEKGMKDPLLGDFEGSFKAVVGHKSSLMNLPEEAVHLAYSEAHEWQGFRINNTYSFQFHPELNYQDLVERLEMYPEYTVNSIDYEKPEELKAKEILQRFIQKSFDSDPPFEI
ncbi:MAG: hypothetical protein ABEI53_01600 [Candidatus Magasanikbacteria bacterium]